MDLPTFLWSFALQIAAYILNRVPSKSVSTISYEIWHGKVPSLKHVKIWRCSAYIKKLKTDKLDARSIQGRFIGYPNDSLWYYFYLHTEQFVVISIDALFLEKEFLQEGRKGRKIALKEVSSNEANQVDQMDVD